jgi:long-chain acyl-CoA synthetase
MGLFKSHKQITVAVGPAQPGETAPRRNAGAKDAEWKAPNNMDMSTVYDLFKWAVAKHAAHQAMGSRTTIKVHTEEKELTKKVNGTDTKVKKTWQFYELTPYKYITYKELDTLVHDLASGIRELGVKPNGEERFHVYSQTSAHWLQTMLACNSQGIPIVTAYDTLGEEGLTHSMVQTKTVAVLVDNDNLHTLVRPLEKATDIRLVVYRHKIDNPDDHPDVKAIRAVRDSIKLISFDDVVALGKANKHQPSPPKADDVCTIMYTSGSTGPPKGVVLLNSTVLAGVAGATGNITTAIISPGDRILAFLPLAHIFELVVELSSLYWGSTLGYGHPKTIVEANMRNCGTDIKELRPTIMVGVPAVWESVRKGVIMKVKQNPPIAQKIFWAAYHSKLALSHWGLGLPLVDSLIFKKVKDATGGRLRYVLNGGAPLSVDTQTFISNLLCPCLLGYGLTETTANTCLMTPANFAIGNLGELTHAITVKLVDVPDAGYFARDNKGEVFIKGPAVSPLYFDNEKETKDAYTDDGWFRTGDIGEWMPNGALKLIDRRKNLVKTLNGEYIALEKLESIYRSNHYVSNICVYADQNRVKPVAIVFPMEKALQELMKEIGTEDETDPKLAAAVTKSLIATGTEAGLKGVELICGTALTETEWTPQNGFLTSAQKLQRKKILADNKDAVEAIYKNNQ